MSIPVARKEVQMQTEIKAGSRYREATRLERLARHLFFKLGGHVLHGQITLREGDREYVFGSVSSPDAIKSTLQVLDPGFYVDALFGGVIGIAESYIRGRWNPDDLSALLRIVCYNASLYEGLDRGFGSLLRPLRNAVHAFRQNTEEGSLRNIMAHYDLGNEFFSLFLDETMAYSSAYFERPDSSLAEASRAKFDRLCRRLALNASDHLLEIGTGWGGFALHAASRYGCRVTTTTISRAQREWATRHVRAAGLQDRVTVLGEDYRKLQGQYDKLVSIEMIEAVGHNFLNVFFECCSRLLKPDGLMALQAITVPNRWFYRHKKRATFINSYIFPGSCLPSDAAMCDCIARKTDLELVFKEDISTHYVRTLDAWRTNFIAKIDQIRKFWPDAAFIRTWEMYFCSCEAGFAERDIAVGQYLFAKPKARPFIPVAG